MRLTAKQLEDQLPLTKGLSTHVDPKEAQIERVRATREKQFEAFMEERSEVPSEIHPDDSASRLVCPRHQAIPYGQYDDGRDEMYKDIECSTVICICDDCLNFRAEHFPNEEVPCYELRKRASRN